MTANPLSFSAKTPHLGKHLKQSQLVEILQLNGVETRGLDIDRRTSDMAVYIADGIANGACEDCPVCGMSSLVWCAGRVTCWGFVDGTTRCPYRCPPENVKRFAWQLPPEIAAKEFLGLESTQAARHEKPVVGATSPPAASLGDQVKLTAKSCEVCFTSPECASLALFRFLFPLMACHQYPRRSVTWTSKSPSSLPSPPPPPEHPLPRHRSIRWQDP